LPAPDGVSRFRPGQGGVVLNVGIGDRALPWASDHLEPGVSVAHSDPATDRALQILSCVGNEAFVVGGAADGARGIVVGKHGTTLVAFASSALKVLAPGDTVCIDSRGVGLEILDIPELVMHSTSPDLLGAFVAVRNGRLVARVVAILPPQVAAAGLGMEASWANIDLEIHDERLVETSGLASLHFGDLVVLSGQDHRYARKHDGAWIAIGCVAHGASVSGGHGLGMTTLLTAPRDSIDIEIDSDATLNTLLHIPERLS
jgi:hypothetical protein